MWGGKGDIKEGESAWEMREGYDMGAARMGGGIGQEAKKRMIKKGAWVGGEGKSANCRRALCASVESCLTQNLRALS